MKKISIPTRIIRPILITLDQFRSLGDLIVRFWIAYIFIESAMSKITSWPATLILFKYDYNVPLISSATAAYLGTGLEFLLPIFLVLGLGGRLSIFIFFIYNAVCVISFHFLWTPAGTAGFDDHVNWGLLLMMLMLNGSGKYSLDYLIHRRYGYKLQLGDRNEYRWPGDGNIPRKGK